MNSKSVLLILMLSISPIVALFYTAQPARAQTLTMNSARTVAVSITGSGNSATLGGYVVEMFQYPERGGAPYVIAQGESVAKGGPVYLVYVGITSLDQATPTTHYSVLAIRSLPNGDIADIRNYHWTENSLTGIQAVRHVSLDPSTSTFSQLGRDSSSQATPNSPNTHALYVNQTIQEDWKPKPQPQVKSSLTPSAIGPQPQDSLWYCSGSVCFWWITKKTWVAWTDVGEAHGSGYMSIDFTYGQSSSTAVDVMVSSGSGWSASGSRTSTAEWDVTWPRLYCCAGYSTASQFSYEEDQLEYCWFFFCSMWNNYQTYTTDWNGGAEAWLDAGLSPNQLDCASPSAIESGQYGIWAKYAAGSSTTYRNSNGQRYSVAASLPNPYGDTNLLQVGLTTQYDSHTTQAFSFGTHYSYYYVYSGVSNSWPIIYTSNTAAHCGP